jgi:tripeptidyl-peptidase I
MWRHDRDGDILVRTIKYSLPAHLDGHIELVQPTTTFHRAKGQRTTFHFSPAPEMTPFAADDKITVPGSSVTVNASCKNMITIPCLKQLYNVDGYVPQVPEKNAIALTGYLGESANFADLQQFYADQVPSAVNTSFDVSLIAGACLCQAAMAFDLVQCDFFGIQVARITRF